MSPEDKLIKAPTYPGGRKAMAEFLASQLQYPKEALEKKIEGIVMVRIDIDGKGNVSKTTIKKSIGYGCDEEAARICKLLKFYVQSKRNVRLTHHKTIKVNFRLPPPPPEKPKKEDSSSTSWVVEYHYVSKSK